MERRRVWHLSWYYSSINLEEHKERIDRAAKYLWNTTAAPQYVAVIPTCSKMIGYYSATGHNRFHRGLLQFIILPFDAMLLVPGRGA
jgi:hypothetical protein